jgi:anaerobic sulfite reductase subunit B
MVGRWGAGEIPLSVTSTQGLQKYIEFGIKKVGTVTTALHTLKIGDTLWVRGPYGNGFNTNIAKKRDVVFIAGGIGIVPLRSLINFILLYKKQPKKIFLLYGSKNPFEILFEEDIKVWNKKGVEVILMLTWKIRDGRVM